MRVERSNEDVGVALTALSCGFVPEAFEGSGLCKSRVRNVSPPGHEEPVGNNPNVY